MQPITTLLFFALFALLSTAAALPAGSSASSSAAAVPSSFPGCTVAKRMYAQTTINDYFVSRSEYNRTRAAAVLSKDCAHQTAANGSPFITNSVDRDTSLGIIYAHGGNQVDSNQVTKDNGVNELTTHANTYLRDVNKNGTLVVSQIFNKDCLIINTQQTYTFPV